MGEEEKRKKKGGIILVSNLWFWRNGNSLNQLVEYIGFKKKKKKKPARRNYPVKRIYDHARS